MDMIRTLLIFTLVVSIAYFVPENSRLFHQLQQPADQSSRNESISTKTIVSWLNLNTNYLDDHRNFESFGDNESVNIRSVNQILILDMPENGSRNFIVKAPDYWETLHSIESKQGKSLYRPRNKAKNCESTTAACGHHQLTVQALKDIGCKSAQCKQDREIFSKSLEMSKALEAKNMKRLAKKGYINLPEYQKYLIHQQGATGISKILDTLSGKKLLDKRLAKNMANNSPYSYKTLRKLGSKLAAKKFINFWEKKWVQEQNLVLKTQGKQYAYKTVVASYTPTPVSEVNVIDTFSQNDIQGLLNLKF
jgi:hypothetical protein